MTEFVFLEKYGYMSINRSVEAQSIYNLMVGTSVVSSLTFFILFIAIIYSMSDVISAHVKVLDVSEQHRDVQIAMNRSRKKELRRNILFTIIFFSIYVVTDVIYVAFAGEMGYMFTVNLVSAIIFICLVFKSYNDIYTAVENTYILE